MSGGISRRDFLVKGAAALVAACAGELLGLTGPGGAHVADAMAKDGNTMQITVKAGEKSIVFELNDSQAARDLYAQLPLGVGVEDYGGKEKIFSPPRKLNTTDTPLVKAAQPGTLAYYAPWGDVVMFYGSFGSAAGLYELGHAIQGGEHIRALSGTSKTRVERSL